MEREALILRARAEQTKIDALYCRMRAIAETWRGGLVPTKRMRDSLKILWTAGEM
jgi:hypothetical protein